MLCHQILRQFHAAYPRWSSSSTGLLAKLRKKTGHTVGNCRKALTLNENDLEKAEKWLNEQALAMGWEKAQNLVSRSTSQGLIGVVVQNKNAALVEVNCETDFVARNEVFQKMVESVALACLRFSEKQTAEKPVSKVNLTSDEIKGLHGDDGMSLADQLVLVIGKIRENLALRRATCYLSNDNIHLVGGVYPNPSEHSSVLLGKYGSIVAFKTNGAHDTVKDKAQELSWQIIGMNPRKVGNPDSDIPSKDPDEEQCLIYQEFMLDNSQNMGTWLSDAGIEVLDFTRYECGENLDSPVAAQARI